MKRIRIGNDIIIRATVTRLGEAEDFTGKTLTLTLRSPYHSTDLPFVAAGNVLTATWLGSRQTKTGTYTVTLVEDYGDGNRNTVDECAAFALVSRSCQEGCGATGRQTVDCTLDVQGSGETTDIGLDISAPANGLSAYEIAVRHGYEGTETEWLASLKASGATTASPYDGEAENATLSEAADAPVADIVVWDEDRRRFLGAVSVETASGGRTLRYYASWANAGVLAPDLYGTATATGRKPQEGALYFNAETDTIAYSDGDTLRPCGGEVSEADIEGVFS